MENAGRYIKRTPTCAIGAKGGAQRRDRVKIKDTFTLKGNCTFTERLVSFDKPEISLGEIPLAGLRFYLIKALDVRPILRITTVLFQKASLRL